MRNSLRDSLGNFRRRALALFFLVSLVPAISVAGLWFWFARQSSGAELISINGLIAPVAAFSLVPAILLSFAFAELLVVPIRQLQKALLAIRDGNLQYRLHLPHGGEFSEMAEALNAIAGKMDLALSQAQTETDVIAAERNKLRAVMDSMADGVYAIDRSNRIMLFNKAAAELTGHTTIEVAGQLAEKMIPLRRQGELVMAGWLADRVKPGRETGEWRNLELYRADSTSLFVNVRGKRLTDDPNGIKALVTFQDISKEYRLEELKVDFVALAAHELRTPITTIRGYLDLLSNESGKAIKPEQRQFLQRSIDSASQLSGLINNLLNISRIERGELALNFETIRWSDLAGKLATDYTARAAAQNRVFEAQIPKSLPSVHVDPSGLTEVLNNLLDNAFKYTPAGGHIELAARVEDKQLVTTITDNGRGIPKEAMSKLFTKFYRVDGLHTTHGTGLGLFISKAIVEAHGGHITVVSELGKQTVFSVILPVTDAAVASDSQTSNNKTKQGNHIHGWLKNSVH